MTKLTYIITILILLPITIFAQADGLKLKYKADFMCFSYDSSRNSSEFANGPVIFQLTEDNKLHASYTADLNFTVEGQMTPVKLQGSLYASATLPKAYRKRFEFCNGDLSLVNSTRPQIIAYIGSANGFSENQERCPTALQAGSYFSHNLGLVNLPGGGTASVSCVITFSNN